MKWPSSSAPVWRKRARISLLIQAAHAPSRAGDGAPAIANFLDWSGSLEWLHLRAFRRGRRNVHARGVRSPEQNADSKVFTGEHVDPTRMYHKPFVHPHSPLRWLRF